MTNSRDFILNSIKESNQDKKHALPSLNENYTVYENKLDYFRQSVKKVGGYIKELRDMSLEEFLKENYKNLGIAITTDKNLCQNPLYVKDFKDPHNLKECDLAIVRGNFGIAENGAVWIREDINLRALYFIAEKLLIILKRDDILNNMYEAYQKIDFEKNGFGVFISGPSKTADIEQSLVIGAHGAMECCILLV